MNQITEALDEIRRKTLLHFYSHSDDWYLILVGHEHDQRCKGTPDFPSPPPGYTAMRLNPFSQDSADERDERATGITDSADSRGTTEKREIESSRVTTSGATAHSRLPASPPDVAPVACLLNKTPALSLNGYDVGDVVPAVQRYCEAKKSSGRCPLPDWQRCERTVKEIAAKTLAYRKNTQHPAAYLKKCLLNHLQEIEQDEPKPRRPAQDTGMKSVGDVIKGMKP